jgi:hypothetical protein
MLLPHPTVSVVVYDLYLIWPQLSPDETEAILAIYADAKLPFAVADQSLKLIAGRHTKIT